MYISSAAATLAGLGTLVRWVLVEGKDHLWRTSASIDHEAIVPLPRWVQVNDHRPLWRAMEKTLFSSAPAISERSSAALHVTSFSHTFKASKAFE